MISEFNVYIFYNYKLKYKVRATNVVDIICIQLQLL